MKLEAYGCAGAIIASSGGALIYFAVAGAIPVWAIAFGGVAIVGGMGLPIGAHCLKNTKQDLNDAVVFKDASNPFLAAQYAPAGG
ncbi:MAG: hypothetical protein K0S29_129 [Gammaproteobacteria bacterium]|nr:hypothetical protein [Gammaproteobacteria bacterium]